MIYIYIYINIAQKIFAPSARDIFMYIYKNITKKGPKNFSRLRREIFLHIYIYKYFRHFYIYIYINIFFGLRPKSILYKNISDIYIYIYKNHQPFLRSRPDIFIHNFKNSDNFFLYTFTNIFR